MRDERPSTTGHRHTLPAEKSSPEKQAEGRAVAVGGSVADSFRATGDRSTQVGGDVSRAGRDIVHAGRDVIQYVQGSPASSTPRVPLAAPAPPEHFTGRASILDELAKRLVSGESVGLTALQGMGGIGKTAVALKLAERLRENHTEAFPGGVLWCGLGPEPEILTVLDAWARAARPDADLSSILEPSARTVAVRQLLASQGRFCAIIDDVWKAEDIRLLLEALPPDTPRLITTRLGDVAKSLRCTVFSLDRLSQHEALELIAKYLGDLGSFEPAARQVVEQTEALPLAIEIAVGLIDAPGELPELADDLAQRSRLEVLARGEVREDSIEVCFSLSYDRLREDDQRRFRALGAFADSPFDGEAVAAVWGEDQIDTARLRFFSRRNLLQRDPSTETLRLHGLVQEHARVLLEQEGETEGARDRHAGHYRRLASSAPWQKTEVAYEQVKHGWSHVENDPEVCVDYALSCVDFQRIRGHWQDRERWLSIALAHAQRGGSLEDRGRVLHKLGAVIADLGRKVEALQKLEDALEVRQEAGDRGGEGETLNSIAAVYNALGRKSEALQQFEDALEVRRGIGDRGGEGQTLSNIAAVYSTLGRKDDALRRFEDALQVIREVGDRRGEGTILHNIALMYSDLGRKDEALRRYEEALEVRREVGDRRGEGQTLNNIAGVYSALGRKDDALRRFEDALRVMREIGDRGGEGQTLSNIAGVYSALGRKSEALPKYEAALEVIREVGARGAEGRTLNNIAGVYSLLGRRNEALQRYEEALTVLREVGDGWMEAMTFYNLGSTLRSLGRLRDAVEALEACVALDEALGHPDLESDRAFLEKVRRELAGSENSA